MSDRDIESTAADAAEQEMDASPSSEEDSGPPEVPLEANTADVAEHARDVGIDEDDYR